MIAKIEIADKAFGDKLLYKDLRIAIERGEKVGLIGRNGTGKSTLFNIISGDDTDYDGEITLAKNVVLISSRQEHHGFEDMSVLEYILADLPEYARLKHVIETYPEHMGESTHKLQAYSDALERFTDLGYYEIENDVERALTAYQLEIDITDTKLGSLSGGQKRMVELVKIQRARADIALIDEPTNHMDYVAKAAFTDWLKSTDEAVVVITHDRDVLGVVDRIIEIRDSKAVSFKGTYTDYLRANTQSMSSEMSEYESVQRSIARVEADINRFRRLKERARDPDTIKRFKSLEQRARKQLAELEAVEKPTFWIDRESVDTLGIKLGESYEHHKARNIRVRTKTKVDRSERELLKLDSLSLGYADEPLFESISLSLRVGGKVELRGRNGAGKTTIVRAILDTVAGEKLRSTVFGGVIEHEKGLCIGIYEQEIDTQFLNLSLGDALEQLYLKRGLPISDEKIRQLLSDYLFNPYTDMKAPIATLSGGQKARFQLISMLAGDPQVLILDEPTNHLDLPSIEELEDALHQYHGAILYISHDSYFSKSLGGAIVQVGA